MSKDVVDEAIATLDRLPVKVVPDAVQRLYEGRWRDGLRAVAETIENGGHREAVLEFIDGMTVDGPDAVRVLENYMLHGPGLSGPEVTCPACRGTGIIEFVIADEKRPSYGLEPHVNEYEAEAQCPVCYGYGFVDPEWSEEAFEYQRILETDGPESAYDWAVSEAIRRDDALAEEAGII